MDEEIGQSNWEDAEREGLEWMEDMKAKLDKLQNVMRRAYGVPEDSILTAEEWFSGTAYVDLFARAGVTIGERNRYRALIEKLARPNVAQYNN